LTNKLIEDYIIFSYMILCHMTERYRDFSSKEAIMKFAKVVFLVAGIYGILVVAPLFLMEGMIDATQPPAITHPEYYYGFACVTLAWQVLFLVLASEPLRYRPMMLVAVLEKASGIAFILLVLLHRSPSSMLIGIVDVALGILFLVAYVRTAPERMLQKMLPV
jgi:hypothetical protein